ncbi:hypothetical protein EBZ35_04195, partial [bacterium]|nr:hypothetical protein [bacterium]
MGMAMGAITYSLMAVSGWFSWPAATTDCIGWVQGILILLEGVFDFGNVDTAPVSIGSGGWLPQEFIDPFFPSVQYAPYHMATWCPPMGGDPCGGGRKPRDMGGAH